MRTIGDLTSASSRRRESDYSIGCSRTATPTCREITLLHTTRLSGGGICVAGNFREGDTSHRPAGVAQLLR